MRLKRNDFILDTFKKKVNAMSTTTRATFPIPEPIADYSFEWTTRRLPDGFNAGIATDEETHATTAGFFDGDGCVCIQEKGCARKKIRLEAREAIGSKNGGNVELKEAKPTRVKAKGANGETLKPNVQARYGRGKHTKDRIVAYRAKLDDGTWKTFNAEKLGGLEKALEQATKARLVPGKRKRED